MSGYGSKQKHKLYFSGKDEEFVAFSEKFEARMFMQKLKHVLDGRVDAKSLTAKEEPTEEELNSAEEKLDELKYEIWCELISVIDNKSINYIRKHKGDGPEAWQLLRSKYKSVEKPRIHNLQQTLLNIKMKPGESVDDYICRAETLQTELEEVEENVTESMFKSIVLGGLPQQYNQIVTLHNFSNTEIPFETLKKNLVNFEQTNKQVKNDESAFATKEKTCYNCGKPGHIKAECRYRNKPETRNTCYNCGKPGHIKDECRYTNKQEPRSTCYNCGKVRHREKECWAPKKNQSNDKYCNYCKKKGHTIEICRWKNNGKTGKERTNYGEEETSNEGYSFLCAGNSSRYKYDVLIDSGCTNYMIKDRKLFTELDETQKGIVGSADSESQIEGRGTVQFSVEDDRGDTKKIELKDALYVPSYSRNLVSVAKLKKSGTIVRFENEDYIETKCGTRFPLITDEELFIWKLVDDDRKEREPMAMTSTLQTWHKRLGHNNVEDLKKLPDVVNGMKISTNIMESCRECNIQKAKRKPINKTVGTRASKKMEIVHVDVLGPIDTVSRDGHKYAIGFIDSWSRFVTVYMMKTRDEVPEKIERYFSEIGTPETLVTDGAKEFTSRYMEMLCRKRGVRRETSAPYTPEENGKIERIWGTVVGMARCLLATAGLDKTYWTYALNHAFYIKNRVLQSAIGKTPYECFMRRKPDLHELKTFGCSCYIFIEKQFRKKLDARANEGIFLGFDGNSQSVIYGIEENDELKIKKSRNVTFDETNMFMKKDVADDYEMPGTLSVNAPTRRELDRRSRYMNDTMDDE
jgi:hypothetical protein